MFVNIIILVALIRLLLATENPVLCASLYAGARLITAFVFGRPVLNVLIGSAIAFGTSFLYFWLLKRFRDSIWFWIVLILGLAIGLV